MSHTPGPWRWDHESNVGNLIVDPERNAVATFQARSHLKWAEQQAEREANARLIAAAPELLEALKEIRQDRDVDMVGAFADGWYAALEVCQVIADRAIAKAEGK
jgi:hypothetical protein